MTDLCHRAGPPSSSHRCTARARCRSREHSRGTAGTRHSTDPASRSYTCNAQRGGGGVSWFYLTGQSRVRKEAERSFKESGQNQTCTRACLHEPPPSFWFLVFLLFSFFCFHLFTSVSPSTLTALHHALITTKLCSSSLSDVSPGNWT